ncbi:MAG: hypothetical protein JNK76_14890 [Planctomycetales bacterium]|nr:hypothetical protein [Planctomycetales bacterium]MBN8626305.1 hypothetical protein [Planctomycetota bacterium]
MSLALPTNIAAHENLAEILRDMMRSLPGPVTFHVYDGRLSGHRIDPDQFDESASLVVGCRFVYVLDGTRGRLEPIAAFIANESLGRAQLHHLIDDGPSAPNGELPRRTTQTLGVYIRSLFADNAWLTAVAVPARVQSLDGLFGLRVANGDVSTVTLTDAGHRPRSSRKWA